MSKADSFYKRNILDKESDTSFLPSLKNERSIQQVTTDVPLPDLKNVGFRNNKSGIYYISDIHLDHKIINKFGLYATYQQIYDYIESIVDGLLLDDNDHKIWFPVEYEIILITGDTSHSFEINKLFYQLLSSKLPCYQDIFVTLGNHELWEFDSVNDAIKTYSDFFDSLPNIHLLQNQLYISNPYIEDPREAVIKKLYNERASILWSKKLSRKKINELLAKNLKQIKKAELAIGKNEEERHKKRIKWHIIPEDDLRSFTVDELQKACFDSRRIVFGTIGFASRNKKFNYESGIYRNTVKGRSEEILLSKDASNIYKKLTLALPNNRLIIASHMPLHDWTELPCQEKWMYFSGHTHNNTRIQDERGNIFADNQVGYFGKRIKFNAVECYTRLDIFAYYKDGIHNVSVDDYYKYYRGMNKMPYIRSLVKDTNFQIKMLKRDGLYLFLLEQKNGKLYLLEGGRRRVIQNQEISYYYDNLTLFARAISESATVVRDYLKYLSGFIKSIGGSGYIHGSIVDIDFFNHIMVNIHDGSIMPYFAESISDRIEYPNLKLLLEENRPDLYRRMIEAEKSDLPSIRIDNNIVLVPHYSTDTSIYRDSNIMVKIQYIIDNDVVRFWDDETLEIIKQKYGRNQMNEGHELGSLLNR